MRPEKMEKVVPVAYVIGDLVSFLSDINSDNPLRIEVELKQQERQAEKIIRDFQKTTHPKTDGYYVSAGIVYKVYHMNTVVKKITGDEAKTVKRMVKKALDKRNESEAPACDERFALEA